MKASASHEATTLMNMKSNAVSGPAKVRWKHASKVMSLRKQRLLHPMRGVTWIGGGDTG